MKQRTIGNEATTPAASANSLYARRCINIRRHSASGVRLFKDSFCSDLLNTLHVEFQNRRARIGHVKLLLIADGEHCVGNLTDLHGTPSVQGRIDRTAATADLVLNARVEMSPEDLERIVRDVLAKAAGAYVRFEVLHLRCLRPGRPRPTHRYTTVVESPPG